MHWFHGFGLRRHTTRLTPEQRHEPFTPGVPAWMRDHPTVTGVLLAATGILTLTLIVRNLADWPGWLLFPSMLLSVPALAAMMLGLGLITVRLVEPALGLMELNWDAEPLNALGLPLPLQRKCEQLGFWAAEDIVRAIDKGAFPWMALEYDERMQIQRSAQRWSVAVEAEKQASQSRRFLSRMRRSG